MSKQPEPCLRADHRCYLPVSCSVWDYCRERNKDDQGAAPTPAQYFERHEAALKAKKEAEL